MTVQGFLLCKAVYIYKIDLGMKISATVLCHGSERWLARFSRGPVPGLTAAWTAKPRNATIANRPVKKTHWSDTPSQQALTAFHGLLKEKLYKWWFDTKPLQNIPGSKQQSVTAEIERLTAPASSKNC
jgi:hypothetical protein